MAKIKIKDDSVFDLVEKELGYNYFMMEGGYVAPNGATIVVDNRRPYVNEVMQFTPNDEGHNENLKVLQELGYLEMAE